MDSCSVRSIEIRIGCESITTCVDINCPKPSRISSRYLIGNSVTIRTILATASRKLLEDDVPVGRFRRNKLLGFQRETEGQQSH